MKKTHVVLVIIASFLIAASVFADQSIAPLTLAFTENSVMVSGVSPRATVYGFSLSREPQWGYQKIVPRETLLTEQNGQVIWTLPTGIPLRSIWFFVDLSTGAYGTGTRPDYTFAHPFTLTDQHLKKNVAGDVDTFSLTGSLVEFVVARPGVGAWNILLVYRDPQDQATEADKITISVFDLKPALTNTEPPPRKLKKGDVVFLMDSSRATYGAARVGE